MQNHDQTPLRMQILDVPVSIVTMASAITTIENWVDAGETRYVCATDVHSVMQAQNNPQHMAALASADMVIPDGTPLVWISRIRGQRGMQRVCGPDIMWHLARQGAKKGWSHYFYGGAEAVAETVVSKFESEFHGFKSAGTFSPPYRTLTLTERQNVIDDINKARPDIVWVGLGCPKQEIWMLENSPLLNSAVVIGVGAAFDFHANRIARAPSWMQSTGLEWFHRLCQEPARLWRRYLIMGPQFVFRAAFETWQVLRASSQRQA